MQELIVNSPPNGVGRIIFYPVYRPFTNESWGIDFLVENSDIVVYDHGVHYQVNVFDSLFVKDMTKLLEVASNATTKKKKLTLLAWRETSTQHFNWTGGHFQGQKSLGETCFAANGDEKGTYTTLMEKAAAAANLTMVNSMSANFSSLPVAKNEFVMLPFREYTYGLHDLHEGKDCTHYCHTPYVWLPLWRSLRIAMDRALKSGQL